MPRASIGPRIVGKHLGVKTTASLGGHTMGRGPHAHQTVRRVRRPRRCAQMTTPAPPPADPVEQLRAVAMLSSLAPTELEQLARAITWVELPGGTVLFRQGDTPDAMYFLLGGRVTVSVTDVDGTET